MTMLGNLMMNAEGNFFDGVSVLQKSKLYHNLCSVNDSLCSRLQRWPELCYEYTTHFFSNYKRERFIIWIAQCCMSVSVMNK